ncbi:hypothetical protein NliqN6_3876 [Naganishia liquefaciens]|uniref:Uncharacterized protein n=1 Tax=Naganishia liquefaciens TaxID=104408 RepID=A0A8H3YFC6_9TREE|nr:hypothetical protein NliqN6_3876 [Naganishia liquefaciens]
MIQKLKKRRPSESTQRPAELSVKIPNSGHAPYRPDSATVRANTEAPLAALPDLFSSQGDFRGSVIIDNLSKRFSVLRAKASPVRATFPDNHDTREPYTPQLEGIQDIRNRLAIQRQNARGMGRYVSEEEEHLVLQELALPEDDTRVFVSPVGFPSHDGSTSRGGSLGSRTYNGFGATAGINEAQVLIKAHNGKRSVSDRGTITDTRLGLPANQDQDPLSSQTSRSGKRKSLLAVLPLETQERITDALMEIEEDLQAEAMEESMLSEAQPSETLMGYVNEALVTPEKPDRAMQHKRQNSSITRSPFKDNLAQIAKGIDMSESTTPPSRTHSVSSHSRGASSISIGQPDFKKSVPGISSASSSRQSSRLGHSRTGSSISLNRFRFGSGLAERGEDVSNTFTLPPPPPAPTGALPPVPLLSPAAVTAAATLAHLEDAPEEAERTPQISHHRTPSASASPIPTASFETGYVPGSVRPFAAAAPSVDKSDSPLEQVSKHNFARISPLSTGRGNAPPLVRKPSKVIPPNRPGPLMLQPTLMPHSTSASSLPSVSPVVETFADSAERKGYTAPGPYSALVEHVEQTVQYGDMLSPTGNHAVPQNLQLESPLEASFDIDGYYGAGRSPVQATMEPSREMRAPENTHDIQETPSLLEEATEASEQNLSKRSSAESLQSTFTENSSELPSPMLDDFPHLVAKRLQSSTSSPLADAFGSDFETEGDDAKQELYDELQAMQERLLEAAREVRRGLNAGARKWDKRRKDVSPGLRTRPSIRRRPEASMYPDIGEKVSELVRAMSPVQPSAPSVHRNIGSPLIGVAQDDTPNRPQPTPALVDTRDSPSPTRAVTARTPEAPSSPPVSTSHSAHTAPSFAPVRSRDTQMQDSSFRSVETPAQSDIGDTSLSPGSTSLKAEDDINRLRDFEARIAHATAQLKATPSVRTKRRPSTKGGAVMSIGTPTLINSSANIKATPIPQSQLESNKSNPRPNMMGHSRHQSSSALPGEKGTGIGGLKGFVAKIKRNASLADRKRSKTSASPRTRQEEFQPFAAITPIDHSAMAPEINTIPVPAGPHVPSSPILAAGSGRPSEVDPEPSRRSLVRRTIILSNPSEGDAENMPSSNVPAAETSDMSRRPSTRRKPVRHMSGDTEIFKAEGLLSAESKSISQVMSASGNETVDQRKSATDSLYDMYADDSNQEEQDHEEVIYSGASASFEDDMQPELYGLSHSTKPRAIEIREMSNGETTWSLLDINDPLLQGIGPAQTSQAHHRNASGTSSLSSYGQESMTIRPVGLDNGATRMQSNQQGTARPKTNIFYSHENDVAELIDDLSRNGFEGKFRIVSPNAEQPQSSRSASDRLIPKDAGYYPTLAGVEGKLQALMQRMRTAAVSPTA